MKKWMSILTVVALSIMVAPVMGQEKQNEATAEADPVKAAKAQKKRAKIDEIAAGSLNKLFTASPKAKRLFEQAQGYAVFDNTKISFGLTGGGGSGVAVDRATGNRTYMKMGTGGVGFGIGAQVYQVIFLFQDQVMFQGFIDKGWKADASANAVAGTAGANAETTFVNGVAVFQLTEAGLMLQADIAGTRYWKSKKLNIN
jgi:lipid-binding SYLF domain-containing protein